MYFCNNIRCANKLRRFAAILLLGLLCLNVGFAYASEAEIADHPTLYIIGSDVYADPTRPDKLIGYQSFEKQHQATIHFTPLNNLEQIIQHVESGAKQDIVLLPHDGINILKHMNLLQPLEPGNIPRFSQLLPQLQSNHWINYQQQYYGVPYSWGPIGLLYNSEKMSSPQSWNVLWDTDYQSQIALRDDISLLWITALSLGYKNVYNLTQLQLDQVRSKLLKLNEQVIDYYHGTEDALGMIRHQQANLLDSWTNPSSRLIQHGKKYKLTIPKEGTVGLFDSFAISASTGHYKLAHQFINHYIDRPQQVTMVRSTGLSPANANTRELLDINEIRELHLDDPQYFDRMLLRDFMPRKQLYDEVLQALRADANKKLGKTPELNLTIEEKRWIINNPVIQFTGDPNWLPYEAITKDGQYIGIVADHLKLIESMTGLTFNTVTTQSWTESLERATAGEVSVISGDAADAILNKRFKPVNAYSHNPIVIIMDAHQNYIDDLNEIKTKKIAIIKDYGYTADIFRTYPDINFIEVENIQQGLLGVSEKRFDAMLATLALASYNLADLGIHNLKIVGKTPIIMDLTLFIDKQEPVLHSIIDKSLKSIQKQQTHKIINKWTKAEYVEITDYTIAYQIGLGALLIFIIFSLWNQRLSREITLRKKTEKEIEQSQARFEAMFQSIPDAIIYADPERRIKLVNQSAIDTFGYSAKELIGSKTEILYASENDYVEQGKTRFTAENTSTAPYIVKYKTKSGHRFPGETLGIPVKSNNGDLLGFLGVIRDISERTHVEAILRSLAAGSSSLEFDEFIQEMLFRLSETYQCKFAFIGLLNDDNQSITTLCVIKNFKIVNNFTYDLNGTPCKDVMDKTVELIPEHAAKLYPEDKLLVSMGIESYFGTPIISSDNKVIGILSVMDTEPLELDQWTEPVLGVFATRVSLELEKNRAIEELKKHHELLEEKVRQRTNDLIKARDEAEQANASKSEFLSRISHELRTPMNAILGFGQILEHNSSNHLSETELGYVREVLKGGYHLLELINEVLDLSRVESGQLQLSFENFELHEVIAEVISLIRPLADQSGITIDPASCTEPVYIYTDRTRLKQILLNLLSNAVKYNRPEGKIVLSCDVTEQQIIFHVKDTGMGIPDDMKDRVFEPFDRLNAGSTNIEGTGIGLSLSKRMIELLGGEIDFESIEGQGTDFWFTLPRGEYKKHAETNDAQPVAEETQVLEEKYTLLYVEDNPANLMLVRQLLKTRGDIILNDAHNASIAMDLLSANAYDLILLDIHLPGEGDGFDILRRIRQNTETSHLPVIAISANATDHDIRKGLDAGFNDYITKPIDISAFMQTIESFISQIHHLRKHG